MRLLSHRTVARAVLACGVVLMLAAAEAQQPFDYWSEVVVTTDALNVREAPTISADRVGQVRYGARGRVQEASPSWADGYWWWKVFFPRPHLEGWVAEGDVAEAYLGDPFDRATVEAFAPFQNTGVWTQGDFDAALDLGLTVRCDRSDREYGARDFMGAPFPGERCPRVDRIAFHRFDDPARWEMEDPAIWLMGRHDVGGSRVYFASWSVSAIRGTGAFGYVNVYRQRPGETPYLAYTISTRGHSYEPERPAEITARVPIHLDGDPNCCPSILIEQTFRADAVGLSLVERRTLIDDGGGLAQRMTGAPSSAGAAGAADPGAISRIATQVADIALDVTLTPRQRQDRVTQLQDRWDAELVATAVRLMPVYDPQEGDWQSFDRWARDTGAETGVDAPFTADPVGSTVRMMFDPSVQTIGDQLGLPTSLSW